MPPLWRTRGAMPFLYIYNLPVPNKSEAIRNTILGGAPFKFINYQIMYSISSALLGCLALPFKNSDGCDEIKDPQHNMHPCTVEGSEGRIERLSFFKTNLWTYMSWTRRRECVLICPSLPGARLFDLSLTGVEDGIGWSRAAGSKRCQVKLLDANDMGKKTLTSEVYFWRHW